MLRVKVIRCCEHELSCPGFTNTCPHCGANYNWAGQKLDVSPEAGFEEERATADKRLLDLSEELRKDAVLRLEEATLQHQAAEKRLTEAEAELVRANNDAGQCRARAAHQGEVLGRVPDMVRELLEKHGAPNLEHYLAARIKSELGGEAFTFDCPRCEGHFTAECEMKRCPNCGPEDNPRCAECGSTEVDDSVVSEQTFMVHKEHCPTLLPCEVPK